MAEPKNRTAELAGRFIDQREIQNVMGKYAFLIMICKDEDIVSNYWSKTAPEPTLARNNGYYIGLEAISAYYKAVTENYQKKAAAAKKLFPKQLENKTDAEIFGVGEDHPRPLTTPVIEIAQDGKTAKGLWQIMGVDNGLTEYGPLSNWNWGYVAADLVPEDGTWKIWHLAFFRDLATPVAVDWADPKVFDKKPEFAGFEEVPLPEPTVKKSLYEAYSPEREYTAPPQFPEPYATFAETFTYGIEKEA